MLKIYSFFCVTYSTFEHTLRHKIQICTQEDYFENKYLIEAKKKDEQTNSCNISSWHGKPLWRS